MRVKRYQNKVLIPGILIALGICCYQPFVEVPTEQIVAFIEPRIEFLKSARFTVIDHSLDMIFKIVRIIVLITTDKTNHKNNLRQVGDISH